MRVSLYVPCGHLLGKGWPLGSRLWCLTVSLSLSHWYPGSGVVLDCIDSWSLHPYLLCNGASGHFFNFNADSWIMVYSRVCLKGKRQGYRIALKSIDKETANDFIEFRIHQIPWKQVPFLHNTVFILCYERVCFVGVRQLYRQIQEGHNMLYHKTRPGGYKTWVHSQTQNKAQWLAACGHMSASSQSLRFILSLRLYSSFITSGPGPTNMDESTLLRTRQVSVLFVSFFVLMPQSYT